MGKIAPYLLLLALLAGCRLQRPQRPADVPRPAVLRDLVAVEDVPIPTYYKPMGKGLVAVHLVINGGVTRKPQQAGLEALTLQAMFRCGAGGQGHEAYSKALDELNAQILTAVGLDYAIITMECPEANFAQSWDLLMEGLQYPDFEEAAYLQLRDEWAALLQEEEKSTVYRRQMAGFRHFFGKEHPFSRHPKGLYSRISRMPVDSVLYAWEGLVRQERLSLVVVGDLSPDLLYRKVQEGLSDLKPDELDLREAPPIQLKETRIVMDVQADATEGTVSAYLPAPGLLGREHAAMQLAMEAWQQAMLQDLCQQRNLTCDVFAQYAPYTSSYAQFGFSAPRCHPATRALVALLAKRRAEGFSPEELAAAKKQLLTRLYIDVESCSGMAEWLGQGLARGALIPVAMLPAQLEEVTPDEVNKVFVKYTEHLLWHYYGKSGDLNERAFKQ